MKQPEIDSPKLNWSGHWAEAKMKRSGALRKSAPFNALPATPGSSRSRSSTASATCEPPAGVPGIPGKLPPPSSSRYHISSNVSSLVRLAPLKLPLGSPLIALSAFLFVARYPPPLFQ